MNCREGDIAIVIYSEAGNEGRLVNVLRAAFTTVQGTPQWWCNCVAGRPLNSYWGPSYPEIIFADRELRPIRPDELKDEERETVSIGDGGVIA